MRTTGRNVFLESFFSSFVIWLLISTLELRGRRRTEFVFNLSWLLLSSLYACIKNIRETQTPSFGKEGVNLQDAN